MHHAEPLQLYLLFNATVIHNATGLSVTVLTTPTSDQNDHSRTYQCMAKNSLGCISTATRVAFLADPTTPILAETAPTPTTFDEGSGGDSTTIFPSVPTFDLMATLPFVEVHEGRRHESACEVTGPVGAASNITWFFNDQLQDLLTMPLEGVAIETSQLPEEGKVRSVLAIGVVGPAHGGTYTCRASLEGYGYSMEAHVELSVIPAPPTAMPTVAMTTTPTVATTDIVDPVTTGHVTGTAAETGGHVMTTTTVEATPTVGNQPAHPPSNLQVRPHPLTADVVVTWKEPVATSEYPIVGYKLNWATPERVTQVARDVVEAGKGSYTFQISRTRVEEPGSILVVLVWPYNIFGDGPVASVEYWPLGELHRI